MTNIELQVLTLLKSALAKYNNENVDRQLRLVTATAILQGILSNPSVQFMPNKDGNVVVNGPDEHNPLVEAAVIITDDLIEMVYNGQKTD